MPKQVLAEHNQQTESRVWLKWLRIAWFLRFSVSAVAIFLPLNHPHIWRQVDTLGVSLRYWLRWAVEPEAPWQLLPAVLHSGDGSGIMAMELPLLNLLAAPLFSFGPHIGIILARGLIASINIALVFWNYQVWRNLHPLKINAAQSWLMMPLFGLGLLYFPRFIPDVMAMLLVLVGIGYLLRRQHLWCVILLFSLGFLIKPTASIVLALLWLDARPLKRTWQAMPFYFIAIVITAFYYLKVTTWIQQVGGGTSLYRLEPQLPWLALKEFFLVPKQFLNLLLQGLGFWGCIPLLFIMSWHHSVRPLHKLWFILLVQILAIAILDGAHAYVHQYYFIGTLPVICLILRAVAEDFSLQFGFIQVRSLLLIFSLGSAISVFAYELKPLWFHFPADRFLDLNMCSRLRAQLPSWPWQEGYVFRTAPRAFPLVGLCFGERVGSDGAEYGIFLHQDPIPAECAVIASNEQLLAVRCNQLSLGMH